MTEPLVPQVNIRLDLFPFAKHSYANVIGLDDEHSPFMAPLCNDFAFLLDVALVMSELDLHALVEKLSDKYQVLGDCRHMEDVPHYPFLTDMAQRDVFDMFDGVRRIVHGFDDSRLLRLLEIRELFFMVPHVV